VTACCSASTAAQIKVNGEELLIMREDEILESSPAQVGCRRQKSK
jgi:hypothetical protein